MVNPQEVGRIIPATFCSWLVVTGCHGFGIFPEILGMSSSQLTDSYFSEGWLKTTNQLWSSKNPRIVFSGTAAVAWVNRLRFTPWAVMTQSWSVEKKKRRGDGKRPIAITTYYNYISLNFYRYCIIYIILSALQSIHSWHYTTSHHVTLHCIVLQCIAVHYIKLHYIHI